MHLPSNNNNNKKNEGTQKNEGEIYNATFVRVKKIKRKGKEYLEEREEAEYTAPQSTDMTVRPADSSECRSRSTTLPHGPVDGRGICTPL